MKRTPYQQKILVNGRLGELRAQLGMAIENVGEVQRSREREREFERFRVIASMQSKLNESFIQTTASWIQLVLDQIPRTLGSRASKLDVDRCLEALNLCAKFEDPEIEKEAIHELRDAIADRDNSLLLNTVSDEPSALYLAYSHLFSASQDLNKDSLLIVIDDISGLVLHGEISTSAQIDLVEEICRVFDLGT